MHINAHSQLLNGWKPPIVAYLTNKKLYSGSQLKNGVIIICLRLVGGKTPLRLGNKNRFRLWALFKTI